MNQIKLARPDTTSAEHEVANLLPIRADQSEARRVLRAVPFWFHTFALNADADLYTPGVARDHRYRIPHIPDELTGRTVLDVGTFDGFYAFLAESRGAHRVLAVDNEQYCDWVRSRWEVDLSGGEGFRAIHDLLGSRVEYCKMDIFHIGRLDECFDFILCLGILHRIDNPLGLLRLLRKYCSSDADVLLETHGVVGGEDVGSAGIQVCEPGTVYAYDAFVTWGFTAEGAARLARSAGFRNVDVLDMPLIDGHRRLVARLRA